jgi:hypothetical protein
MLLTVTVACKQTYLPPIVKNPPVDLVVEGFINNGPDSTWFNLTNTYQLGSDSNAAPVLGATVSVQGNDNTSYTLNQTCNTGLYTAHLPPLNPNSLYRLHITTTGGIQYASDYVPVMTDPPIDSVNFIRSNNGVNIYVNTHDPTGKARYYRWEYQETWQFTAGFEAGFKWMNDSLYNYDPDTTYTCWKTDINTNIILGTSTALASDIISAQPIVSIPLNAQQLSILYSIYVRQYAVTVEAFNWWSIMQNNTEDIGSIFGVQPTIDQGNLHCLSDSSQQVIGYVSAGTIQTQRVFITVLQVWPWDYLSGCNLKVVSQSNLTYYQSIGYLLVDYAPNNSGFLVSLKTCVDCTLNGSNKKPPFWP